MDLNVLPIKLFIVDFLFFQIFHIVTNYYFIISSAPSCQQSGHVASIRNGWQQLFMGCCLCTGPQFGFRVGSTPSAPSWGEFKVKGNTPDFILEHYIVLSFDGTYVTFHMWEFISNKHGYLAQPYSGLKLKMKHCNTFTMISFTVTIILL